MDEVHEPNKDCIISKNSLILVKVESVSKLTLNYYDRHIILHEIYLWTIICSAMAWNEKKKY